jgi:hypothetical protein
MEPQTVDPERQRREESLRRAQSVLAGDGSTPRPSDRDPLEDVGASWWRRDEREAAVAWSEARNREIERKMHETPGSITDDDLAYLDKTLQRDRRREAHDARARATAPPSARVTGAHEEAIWAPLTALVYRAVDAGDLAADEAVIRDSVRKLEASGLSREARLLGIGLALDLREHVRAAKMYRKRCEDALAALDARIKALEVNPAWQYRGTFDEGSWYDPNELVTHAGSLWFCRRRTNTPPGDADSGWTLIVKRGRDGRDGKS